MGNISFFNKTLTYFDKDGLNDKRSKSILFIRPAKRLIEQAKVYPLK